jgi:hypothetical protein
MATTLDSIMDMMLPLIPDDYKTEIAEDSTLAYRGLIETGMALNININFYYEDIETQVTDEAGVTTTVVVNKMMGIEEDLSSSEKYLASYYAYRAYLMKLKDELNRDAINFKTLTFEIKSLEKRPEAINDSIYYANRYLDDLIAQISGSKSLSAVVVQFGDDD